MAITLNPSLLYKLYMHDSTKGGTQGGLITQENFNENSYRIVGNQVIVTEADGDTFTYDLSQIGENATEEFFADALNSDNPIGQVQTTPAGTTDGQTGPVGENTANNNTKKTTRTQAQIQADLDALKERREKLEQEIKDNNGKIEDYKDKIDALYKEIEETIGEYIDQAVDITEDVKEQVKKATEKHIEKYKNGEYDSTKSLHNALAAEISNIMSAGAMGHLMEELERVLADKKAEVEPYIAEIETIEGENETIETEIESITTEEGDLQTELEEAKKQEQQQQQCEPQGFAITDAEGAVTQFDFFVDRDGNGDLTDASEFLGAQSYEAGGKEGAWSEMTTLDTNGDGVVDVGELEAGNVKVVKTTIDANGNKVQEAMSASEAFGKDADLKINTTQHAENSESDVPVNFDNYENNELLGNFDVTLNGETYTGYQTADSMDYLNDNYNFTSGSAEGEASVFENAGAIDGKGFAHRMKGQFKYDIDSVVRSIDVSDSESELLDFAEDLCESRGIRFGNEEITGENADDSDKQLAGATAAQTNVMEDLKKLAKEFDFEIAA